MTHRLKGIAQVIAFALVAGLLALLVWSVVHQQHAPGVGSVAPAFTLRRLHGPGTISLASYRGKPVGTFGDIGCFTILPHHRLVIVLPRLIGLGPSATIGTVGTTHPCLADSWLRHR